MIHEILEELAVLVERGRPLSQGAARRAARTRAMRPSPARAAAQARGAGKVIGSRGTAVDPRRRKVAQHAANRGGAQRAQRSRRRNAAARQQG